MLFIWPGVSWAAKKQHVASETKESSTDVSNFVCATGKCDGDLLYIVMLKNFADNINSKLG